MDSPRVFRSYGPFGAADYPDLMIWQAARATSAAPTFFKPMRLGPRNVEEEFLDGGMGTNNPTKILIEQTVRAYEGPQPVACIVSIGCGASNIIEMKSSSFLQRFVPLELINALRAMVTDCKKTAFDMETKFRERPDTYFRFNVEQGLQDVGLDEWKEMGAIRAKTIEYLHHVEHTVNQAVAALATGESSISVSTLSA